jgi:hypothetical protein
MECTSCTIILRADSVEYNINGINKITGGGLGFQTSSTGNSVLSAYTYQWGSGYYFKSCSDVKIVRSTDVLTEIVWTCPDDCRSVLFCVLHH